MQIIVSNDLMLLCESLTREFAKPHQMSPLAEDWILVGNRDTGRWVQKHLTDALGGLANTRFLTVAQAISELSRTNTETALSSALFWSVATHWQHTHPDLQADDLVPQVILLTQIFNRYLTERPDWLARWDQGQTDNVVGSHWQSTLWSTIVKDLPDHPHHRLLDLARGRLTPEIDGVARIFIFAPDRLPPLALETFARISLERPVTMWIQSPSPEGWFLERDAELVTDHSLLLTLGAERGRLMRQLSEESLVDGYFDPLQGSTHALAQLRNALYANQHGKAPIEPDVSLRFVSATSPTQEVEALKSWLVDYLNHDSKRSIADVTVVSPNPGLYGPLVQRIFNDLDAGHPIPTAPDPLIQQSVHDACLDFLFTCRRFGFRANRVLGFLTIEAIRGLFDLTDRDIRLIESWLIASGARRAVDRHKHSLKSAKARLLRGLLVDTEVTIEADATPTEPIEQSLRLDILIAVFDAIEAVMAIPDQLTPTDATKQLTECISLLTLGQLKALEIPVIPEFAADRTVDFRVFMASIEMHQNTGLTRPVALNDQISVTSPQTIRHMHWPVVAILGANDGTFPSEPTTHAWDLTLQHPRAGDLIAADSERQALLDIVLNTESQLWISWQGEHPISLKEELPGAGIMAILSALNPDPKAQKHWIERLPTGLALPTAIKAPAILSQPKIDPQRTWTRHALIEAAVDPARAFLKRKGATLKSPPDDRLDQEPLALTALDKYRLRDEFLQTGRPDRIETWLNQHPEFPSDLDSDLIKALTPENIRLARTMQGPEFPNTVLELGDFQIEIRDLPRPSVPRFTSDEKPNRQRTLGALIDVLMCFALEDISEPVNLVTFNNKIHPLGPMPMDDARHLLTQWCEALCHLDGTPCPLIAPLALQHAESLAKDPDEPIEIGWGIAPLLHKPHYRRLFAHDPDIKRKHLDLVDALVVPLLQLFVEKHKNAF
jgi:exonuclease V gamma subunit